MSAAAVLVREARAAMAPVPVKARVSIEAVLQWAFAPGREGGRAWRLDAALAFDEGLTARPRRRARGGWLIAEACAGMRFGKAPPGAVTATSDDDAALVASLVQALPSAVAERVRAHARAKTRPDWLDTEMRRERMLDAKRRVLISWTNNRNRKVQYCPLQTVFDRKLTLASMRRWNDWRQALVAIQDRLGERLRRWEINGYLPKEEPWRTVI